ncbi:AGE family epimerase/isomerase [Amphiplicatus metriothermophilus]|uniref:Cellobiose 2-epimerase n=1 Tax=Amphiplicatus metriothermophilus TaxID=1519374 RepID=A0A239PX42_9PROT|nr:AGE family epimerase/isomerase [Amphiplicatus metriothermophilus]MBB5519990.1 mannobiose 2-epimerase [Amphiplicatus metriothermophilus]SNT74889.1 mannobiose 2-epimerase [Amphiplicatus metriothermophilus]
MTPTSDLRQADFERGLDAIAAWWLEHGLDPATGGAHGEIAEDNAVRADAERGAVLETRALWFFSALARARPSECARAAARRLYRYVTETFVDAEHGGLVWSVAADGTWTRDRKQVYAQAFAIYAFCACAAAFDDVEARDRALALARLLEERAWDQGQGGYLEAFARDWSPVEDMRLSARDLNAPKTMNTHLHMLEAYTSLHALVGDDFSRRCLTRIFDLFLERFVRPRGAHVSLFYSADWRDLCADESYGHDIETSWLLCEAAGTLGDADRKVEARAAALTLAEAALDALDGAGGLVYERHADARGLVAERHWWPQAEALVGFYNAHQLSGEARYAEAAARVWHFIRTQHIDEERGEWLWLARADAPKSGPYKAGFWKGPYHNGRAMMEMIRRLEGAPA